MDNMGNHIIVKKQVIHNIKVIHHKNQIITIYKLK